MTASTVLIQQVPFFGLYFDEQVPSLQIRITVLFSADLQTPRTTEAHKGHHYKYFSARFFFISARFFLFPQG